MDNAWICFVNFRHDALQREIRALLAECGVTTVARTSRHTAPYGLLVFDQATDLLWITLEEFRREGEDRMIAVQAGPAALDGAVEWELLRRGASDVRRWGSPDSAAWEIARKLARWKEIDELLRLPAVSRSLIGGNVSWRAVLRSIAEAAHVTDDPILITGETGTGKERIAQAILEWDAKRDRTRFETVDCTTIVSELSASEFFGHSEGAFTTALKAREGAFKRANNGFLFLDEAADLPPAMQSQLLRAIQEKRIKPVGSNHWFDTDFRLVCATNRDLQTEVECGRFRRDLYYRLAVQSFRVPPLREREDDIIPLALHFLTDVVRNRAREDRPCDFDQGVKDFLLQRQYPGNVRDLLQLVRRLAAAHVGRAPISLGDIPSDERGEQPLAACRWHDVEFYDIIARAVDSGVGMKEIGRAAEETAIRIAIDREHGNISKAAQCLGITPRALQMRRAIQKEQMPEASPSGDG
jgi:transcriptional regulator with GAF, ATPase, and Fis domain